MAAYNGDFRIWLNAMCVTQMPRCCIFELSSHGGAIHTHTVYQSHACNYPMSQIPVLCMRPTHPIIQQCYSDNGRWKSSPCFKSFSHYAGFANRPVFLFLHSGRALGIPIASFSNPSFESPDCIIASRPRSTRSFSRDENACHASFCAAGLRVILLFLRSNSLHFSSSAVILLVLSQPVGFAL